MSVNLMQYLPRYYDGSYEMEELTKAEDYLFDNFFIPELDALAYNQFIKTADENTVYAFERMIGITANPVTESIEFRRERLLNRFSIKLPYSLKFLTNRLDAIIGKDKYTMTMDYDNYTLTVEASAADQVWYEEISIMINSTKPANIVFKNVPLIATSIVTNEAIIIAKYTYNYRAGTTARTNLTKPIATLGIPEDVLGADTLSIQQALLDRMADFAATEVTNVLINDSLVINTFFMKDGDTNTIKIQYIIPSSSGITVVNNIKLRNAANVALTNAAVYFTVGDDVTVKHTIPIKEGV